MDISAIQVVLNRCNNLQPVSNSLISEALIQFATLNNKIVETEKIQNKIKEIADELFIYHFQHKHGGLNNLRLINKLLKLSKTRKI